MKASSLYSQYNFVALTRIRPIYVNITTQRYISSDCFNIRTSKEPQKSFDSTTTPHKAAVSQATAEVQRQDDGKNKEKTMAEMDEELRLTLEGISGEGGEAGLELEDGKPVAMKRGVKENMFRLI